MSFARTIHTYQGQSAGPTNDKYDNPIKRIICDVGSPRFESQNIGLLYTALSRATTIGTKENSRINSAIFFTQSLDKQRLDRLTTKSNEKKYEMIAKRENWIKMLTKNINEKEMNIPEEAINEIFEWASNAKIPLQIIQTIN